MFNGNQISQTEFYPKKGAKINIIFKSSLFVPCLFTDLLFLFPFSEKPSVPMQLMSMIFESVNFKFFLNIVLTRCSPKDYNERRLSRKSMSSSPSGSGSAGNSLEGCEEEEEVGVGSPFIF